MRFTRLKDWLDWQQSLHFQEIDLGLERIKSVLSKLKLAKIAPIVITVAGTNGKGSSVAYYAHFLKASGYKVASFTSPHLIDYNERIVIDGLQATDTQIMRAFDVIDQARGDLSLTYFEFGALAAFYCIQQAQVDVAVLEVGLGGRLDAVNIIDADLVHFTPVGIDHTAWLGSTRELIAIEKAGVLRDQCLVICNDLNPTQSMLQAIHKHAKKSLQIGQDYSYDELSDSFQLADIKVPLSGLSLVGEHQKLNCSGVLAGLHLLDKLDADVVQNHLQDVNLKGRFETVYTSEDYKLVVDVGHNEDAAIVLANELLQQSPVNSVMILGMLEDKSVNDFTKHLSTPIDHCICVGLSGSRGLSATDLLQRIDTNGFSIETAEDIQQAVNRAEKYLISEKTNGGVSSSSGLDIILVTGSFYTVEAFLKLN
ncbi:MAG: bifunctional folylpolyglutamate synthase/dihydrofolate synthase [Gammaproteobacteria bacterium]|nr:bifunctional folylpolyglutamate synthase/dihydrofolate synthase [Gammaproteobacteria bacterium]